MESNKQEFFISRENCKINENLLNEEYRVKINHLIEKDPLDSDTNCISTSKYNYLNCIPKILIEQFSKMANIYFLMIAIMQVIIIIYFIF